MRSAPKRIGLFGNFGTGNFGNESSLEAVIQLLREKQPDAQLTCLCGVPEKVRLDHKIEAVAIRWPGPPLLGLRKFVNWIHACRTVRKLDVLIMPGTGILCDFSTSPLSMPYALLLWCLLARLCGTRIAFVSVGAGPISHPTSRWLIKHATSMAQYRSFRNKFSKEFVKSLGLNTANDPIYPDIAFRLPVPPPAVRSSSAKVKRSTVCVGVMQYHGWSGHLRTDDRIYEGYLGKLTEFVLWLLDQDFCVRIIMGDEGDQKAVDDLVNAVVLKKPSLPEAMLIAEPAHSGLEVMRQLADADIVVSSRFHNLVFALMLGKLTISTGYTEYHKELLADMGLGAFCQHSENIKVETLISQFRELMTNRSHYEAVIRDAVAAARKSLAHQDRVFVSQFLEPAFQGRTNSSLRSDQETLSS